MGLLERQARELPYDDSEPLLGDPMLEQDPNDPHHYTYTSPAVPLVGVRLERGQRGNYGWTIHYEGVAPSQVLEMLRQMDRTLRAEYGGG
jgi:hypothetical protein